VGRGVKVQIRVLLNNLQVKPHLVLYCLQVEEMLVRRKKTELLEKYTSETLQQQAEESKALMGYS
jgi:hypothetical protein